jgi:hypothetical protein
MFAPAAVAALYVRDESAAKKMHGVPISHHYPHGLISECGSFAPVKATFPLSSMNMY